MAKREEKGKARHMDEKEDKALIKKMVKKEDLKSKANAVSEPRRSPPKKK